VPSAQEPEVGRPLPNAHLAWVPRAKLYDYALNPLHVRGGSKARLWRAVFDVGREDWEYVRDQIVRGVSVMSVSGVNEGPFERTYEVIVAVRGLNGREGPVITAWKLVNGAPCLVTAFPR
jgi:hypothetical protein